MIRPLLALVALAVAAPWAQALTLEEALAHAVGRPDALNARLELLQAETDRLRTEGDPLALRLDKLQAEQAVTLARAELRQAFYAALADIAGAYTGLLQARERAALAERGAALSQRALEIARVRRANGSATDLDVREAEVSLEEAEKNAAAARSALQLAQASLEGMIGERVAPEQLEPVPDAFLLPLPTLEDALAAAREHPQLVQARQGLELARVGLELLDPSYAAPAQREAAQTQLETTERLVAEAERGFELQVRNLHLQAESAAEGYRVARASLENAETRLASERTRFESGLIAQVQLDQAELEAAQAKLAALQARHDYLAALLALQAGSLLQLSGPAVLDFAQQGALGTEEAAGGQ